MNLNIHVMAIENKRVLCVIQFSLKHKTPATVITRPKDGCRVFPLTKYWLGQLVNKRVLNLISTHLSSTMLLPPKVRNNDHEWFTMYIKNKTMTRKWYHYWAYRNQLAYLKMLIGLNFGNQLGVNHNLASREYTGMFM